MPRAMPARSLPPLPLGGGAFGPMSGMVPFLETNLASAAQKARVNPNPAALPKVPKPALATPEGIVPAANMASFKAPVGGLSASPTPSLVVLFAINCRVALPYVGRVIGRLCWQ